MTNVNQTQNIYSNYDIKKYGENDNTSLEKEENNSIFENDEREIATYKDTVQEYLNSYKNIDNEKNEKGTSKLNKFIKNLFSKKELKNEDKAELDELYSNLEKAKSPEMRDSIKAQIQSVNYRDSNPELSEMYEDLANAKSPETRESIKAKIQSVIYRDSNPELSEMYEDLANAISPELRDSISARINAIKHKDNPKLADLYTRLAQTTSPEERDSINGEIKQIFMEMAQ